ncbi:rust resistance kinase Lr10 [Trifolium repens]|nr:rust resistance kinase Lr10 [Trifolium repens]
MSVVNGVGTPKIESSWDEDDKKKVLNDKKAINILQSALIMDEFFRISQCQTTKEIWDTLVETHEGTVEVKRSRLNTLSQEYELFRMQPGESILNMQKRFVHLANHLNALGKTLTNDELNLKVLRSLTREWQPKVTAISEKKCLSKMSSATLFGKLQEYETELGRLEKHENQDKKSKSIALKVDSKENEEEDDPEEDENFMHLVKRLSEFFINNDNYSNLVKKKNFFNKNEASTSTQNVTCYECGKQGHIKTDCPRLAKKSNFKRRKGSKPKKAYIAWDDNEVSSSTDSESKEYANLALMASHHFDGENEEVSSKSSSCDNDYQSAIYELLNECKILYKTVSTQKKKIQSLEEKIDTMKMNFEVEKQSFLEKEKQNFTCKECDSLSFQIVQLKRVIERYEKGQVGLDNILSQQRYSNDKSGLGYSKFDKPSTSKTFFVKAIDQSNKEKVNKAQKVKSSS